MGLVLDLNVSTYPGQCPTPAEYPSAPSVTAAFDLTPLTIAAQPTNSTNGLALGLEGTTGSVGSGAAQFTVNGLVNGQTPPKWQVSLNSSTILQGISGAVQLTTGVPVDMDVTIQQDGSLVATRVSVLSTETTTLTVVSGPLIAVSSGAPVTHVVEAAQQGYLPAQLVDLAPPVSATHSSRRRINSKTWRPSPSLRLSIPQRWCLDRT
jgi:hypothetical protein